MPINLQHATPKSNGVSLSLSKAAFFEESGFVLTYSLTKLKELIRLTVALPETTVLPGDCYLYNSAKSSLKTQA